METITTSISKTIFDISGEYKILIDQLEESGGELTPEIVVGLEISKAELAKKSAAYLAIIKRIKGDVDLCDKEIKDIEAIKNVKKDTIERLKKAIQNAMETCQVKEIASPTWKIQLCDNPESVKFEDESLIPEKYREKVVTEKISKEQIKKDIKAGESVPGAYLERGKSLRIK